MKSHLSEHLFYDSQENMMFVRLSTLADQDSVAITGMKQQYHLRKQIEQMRKARLLTKTCGGAEGGTVGCEPVKQETAEQAIPFTTGLVASTEFAFKCDRCSLKFMRSRELSEHRSALHGVRDRNASATCDLCGQTFGRGYMLQYHMLTHMDQDAFQCNVCHVSLANPTSLKLHKQLHTGTKHQNHKQKLVRCPVCGKHLTSQGKLRIHMAVHNREGPIACALCPRQFLTLKAFYNHKYKHTFDYIYTLWCTNSKL